MNMLIKVTHQETKEVYHINPESISFVQECKVEGAYIHITGKDTSIPISNECYENVIGHFEANDLICDGTIKV